MTEPSASNNLALSAYCTFKGKCYVSEGVLAYPLEPCLFCICICGGQSPTCPLAAMNEDNTSEN